MSNTIKKFFAEHYWAFVAALLCGVIIFLPQWWLTRDAGSAYSGVIISEVDNDHYYLSRVAAAYRGDVGISQAAVAGTANQPYTSPPLAEDTVAGLAHILGLTPYRMQFFGEFLFPALLAFLLYFLAWQVTGSKLVAFLTPLGVILGSTLVMDFHQLGYFLRDHGRLWTSPYNRPVHPQISSIYFYGWLLSFYSYWLRPSKLKLVLSGGLLGLLFYVYPFSWTVALTFAGFAGIFALVRRDWTKVKQLLLMGLLALAVSSAYWYNFWQLSQHPLFGLIREHFVIYRSRGFLWSNLLFVDFAGLAIFFWRRPKDQKFYFFLAMFLTFFVVLNQQVVTGLRMFPGHWHWYYVVPVSIFFWIYLVDHWAGRRALQQAFVFVTALFFLAFGFVSQHQYYLRNFDAVLSYQRFGPVYNWLAANAIPGSVVVADDKFSERLPIYSSLYHYIAQGADELYLIRNEQIQQGFFVKLYLQGVRSDLEKHISPSTSELMILLSGYYRRYALGCKVCYTPEEIEGLRRKYREFLQKDFYTELKRYQVDYAVWDPNGQFQSFDRFGFMRQVAEIDGLKIYKVD